MSVRDDIRDEDQFRASYASGERDFERLHLPLADLAGMDLESVRFSHAELSGTNLEKCDLTLAWFDHATLKNATLSRARLRQAHLNDADLSRARLHEAWLDGADLRGANLRGADLTKADLCDVDLSGADLTNARLVGANLARACLRSAKLQGANLQSANFTYAELSDTYLLDIDLSEALNLRLADHSGPSHVGERTFRRSKGKIDERFLAGCGLSNWEIQMCKLYDLTDGERRNDILYEIHRLQEGQPILYHSVFISYSSKDEEFARKLHDDLQREGIRCWFAPHDLQGGKKLHEQIDRAIQVHDRLLLVLSEASMSSNWVKTEIANARTKEREQGRTVLFPISLVPFDEVRKWSLFDADSGDDSAREIREYAIPDFQNWRSSVAYRARLERLVRDLRAEDRDRTKDFGSVVGRARGLLPELPLDRVRDKLVAEGVEPALVEAAVSDALRNYRSR